MNLNWQVKSIPQVEAAFGFLSKVGPEPYDLADLEKACGAGTLPVSDL